MTAYFIRRIFQMILVVLISAVASYALLNFAPGGPLQGLRQIQQGGRFQITEDDIARIRAYFELDLFLPYRFTRWLIGEPRGPLVIGGQEYFADLKVGCRKPIESEKLNEDTGEYESIITGCKEDVLMKDLVGRRTSRGVLLGDFGLSWKVLRDRPVTELLASRIPKTIQLIGLQSLLSILIGIPLGVYSAIRQYSRFDYIFTSLAFMGSAMPTFFFGILLILAFSIIPKDAGWAYLPAGLSESIRDYSIPIIGAVEAGSLKDRFLHLILPLTVLTMVNIAGWSRFVRASMLEVMRQDYVRTARAKGLAERIVIFIHMLKNALIPVITILGPALAGLVTGSFIIETMFSFPGMGRAYVQAIGQRDYSMIMGTTLIYALLVAVANLSVDIVYVFIDPRIRLEE